MLNSEQKRAFCTARRAAISTVYPSLNDRQLEGVLTTEGPLLLLAGAGSGKTTVLINRITNLIRYGKGSDCKEVPDWVTEDDLSFLEAFAASPNKACRADADRLCAVDPAPPWTIIAITFTNRAANEMKERLQKMLGDSAQGIWASTFHSACVRILRKWADRIGFPSSFAIYDTDDSLRIIKDCVKEQQIDEKTYAPRAILSRISKAKDAMKLSRDYAADSQNSTDPWRKVVSSVYTFYERALWEAGAMDFDDIILHTVRLLQQDEEVRLYYQNKFRYVLIDEYQDTNNLQYLLASLLAGGRQNICVVGDDDQSIYRFRGATIENILNFEKQYKGCRTIRLEENYRSTANILSVANAVIRNNKGRKGKTLWTAGADGSKVIHHTAEDEREEARYVSDQVLRGARKGKHWRDYAVLYRTNAQSNQIEMALKRAAIPYRIYGGTRFFDRAEVKDMLAYLNVINNHDDDLRLRRIINNPPRGIGAATIDHLQEAAREANTSIWEVITHPESNPLSKRVSSRLSEFISFINEMSGLADTIPLDRFYQTVVNHSGYITMLQQKGDVESRTRMENVQELLTSVQEYANENDDATLSGFLSEVALFTDLDNRDPNEDAVTLMTMHSAKGLEFPTVFVVGMEEGIFPNHRTIENTEDLEEERRLCYVAITRAKEELHLVSCRLRTLYGRTGMNPPSRFIHEIPADLVEPTGYIPDDLSDVDEEDSPIPSRFGWNNSKSTRHNTRYAIPGTSTAKKPLQAEPHIDKPRHTRSQLPKTPNFSEQGLIQLEHGDRVSHTVFGVGTVLSAVTAGNDVLASIDFPVGVKRMMLRTASQYLTKLED